MTRRVVALGPGPAPRSWTVAAVDTLGSDGPAPGARAEGGPASVESILLVPTPRSWRVGLLHRSAVP